MLPERAPWDTWTPSGTLAMAFAPFRAMPGAPKRLGNETQTTTRPTLPPTLPTNPAQGWWAGLVAGLVSMIDGSPALQARRHSRPDSMLCMQLAGSSSIRPRCRATLASAVTTNHPRKTEKLGRDFPGVATAPLVLPVRSSRIHQGPGKARQRSQCVPQFQRR